jgi:hypothetical protein
VNKLDLLFDSKQFAVVFGAAIGESRSEFQTCRPAATAKARPVHISQQEGPVKWVARVDWQKMTECDEVVIGRRCHRWREQPRLGGES